MAKPSEHALRQGNVTLAAKGNRVEDINTLILMEICSGEEGLVRPKPFRITIMGSIITMWETNVESEKDVIPDFLVYLLIFHNSNYRISLN